MTGGRQLCDLHGFTKRATKQSIGLLLRVVVSMTEPALELVSGTALQVVDDHRPSIYSTAKNRNV